jgi:16S rRNA (uracil1498-N3)-methyltransferase
MEDLTGLAATHQMIVLEPDAPVALSAFVPEGVAPVVLVVGPEGGISPGESERLREAGAQSYRLGSSVLRTSTAGMAALALVSVALGRW